MAISYYYIIFSTFLLSCVSIALLVGSLATDRWLESEIEFESLQGKINYGLFSGTFTTISLGTGSKPIYFDCVYEHNICAFSCEKLSTSRKDEIMKIYEGKEVDRVCGSRIENRKTDFKWFNSGVYLSGLIFLGLALIFALMCGLLGVYNSTKSPVEPLLNIFGLYIWHGCSIACSLLALILWGTHFDLNLKEDLGFTYVMVVKHEAKPSIGYSYWFVLASTLCHIISEVLLVFRLWKIRSEPPPAIISIENNTDNSIFLY